MRHAGREGGKGESGANGSGAAVSGRIRTAAPGVKTAGGESGADAREGREYFLTPI